MQTVIRLEELMGWARYTNLSKTSYPPNILFLYCPCRGIKFFSILGYIEEGTIMNSQKSTPRSTGAIEDAAKYICTMKCGMCPMAVEQFPCPQPCTLEVLPWQCWIAYFQRDRQPLADDE
jgi:hypothetical protein